MRAGCLRRAGDYRDAGRWVLEADLDDRTDDGLTSVEYAEIKSLKAENTRLPEVVGILRASTR